jgi:hypothetical protein
VRPLARQLAILATVGLSVLLNCGDQKMHTTGPEIAITEGTVAPIEGVRVAAANIWERDYELPDKTTRHGPAAMLFVNGENPAMVVGAGSVVSIGGTRWIVLGVTPGKPRGEVRIAPLK